MLLGSCGKVLVTVTINWGISFTNIWGSGMDSGMQTCFEEFCCHNARGHVRMGIGNPNPETVDWRIGRGIVLDNDNDMTFLISPREGWYSLFKLQTWCPKRDRFARYSHCNITRCPVIPYGLVTPYGSIHLGQHWPNKWLPVWRQDVIIISRAESTDQ